MSNQKVKMFYSEVEVYPVIDRGLAKKKKVL